MHRSQSFRDAVRLTGLLGVLVLVGLMATACGSNNGAATKAPQLRVWRVDQNEDVIADIKTDFLEANKGADFSYKKKSLAGYELAALKSLSARQGPDIWSIPNDWLGDHKARLGWLGDTFFQEATKDAEGGPYKPVDWVKKIYPAGIAESITIDGHVYGLPTGVDTLRLYYNPEIFGNAYGEYEASLGEDPSDEQLQPVQNLLSGSPRTWAALVEQSKYITRRDGATITRSAIALGTADNSPNTADVLQLLIMQNDGQIVSTDHTRALFHIPKTTPAGVSVRPGENALDFLTSFSNPSKSTYTWNPSMPQALDAFGQGKVAMVIGFTDFEKQLRTKYPRMEFEVAPVPQISTAPLQPQVNLIRFWTETIPRIADNPQLALNFLRLEAAYADSLASEAGLSSPYLATLAEDPEEFPNKQILNGKAVYKKDRELFDAAFRQMIVDVSQNGLTPAQALDSGSEKINVLLAQPDE
ncbi:MAG TPA: extracellular solute-binding protein [Verrucomicrobiae bacterium]|nr:extracellular solute-binding protein [Verrucomicrobiae bacterium]